MKPGDRWVHWVGPVCGALQPDADLPRLCVRPYGHDGDHANEYEGVVERTWTSDPTPPYVVEDDPLPAPTCRRCGRPAVGWPLDRGDRCPPPDWRACIRDPAVVRAENAGA